MDGGIRLTADGERGSWGAERCEDGFRAGGGGAWPGLRPGAWRQRKRRSVPAESERYTACVQGEGFFSLLSPSPFSLSSQPVQLLPYGHLCERGVAKSRTGTFV